jgi:hypothetical protein
MLKRQVDKGFLAGRHDRCLPARNRRGFQAGGIRKISSSTACGRGQPRIRLKLHANGFRFSVHECSPTERRRLPGNPGSSRGRRHPSGRCAGLCRWCNISRSCNALPAYRTSRKRRDRAWDPPGKTVPEHGDARQGARWVDGANFLLNVRLNVRPWPGFLPRARSISRLWPASLTHVEAHASIDFCPEPSEWKPPTRPQAVKLARLR